VPEHANSGIAPHYKIDPSIISAGGTPLKLPHRKVGEQTAAAEIQPRLFLLVVMAIKVTKNQNPTLRRHREERGTPKNLKPLRNSAGGPPALSSDHLAVPSMAKFFE
jgi:hypothetical protein